MLDFVWVGKPQSLYPSYRHIFAFCLSLSVVAEVMPKRTAYPSLVPVGKDAVGASITRDFGEDEGGIFSGTIDSARHIRSGWIYHVLYEDGATIFRFCFTCVFPLTSQIGNPIRPGDQEEMDQEEFHYAYELAVFEARGDSSDDEQRDWADDSGYESELSPPSKKIRMTKATTKKV